MVSLKIRPWYDQIGGAVLALSLCIALMSAGCAESGGATGGSAESPVLSASATASVRKIMAEEAHNLMTSNEVVILDVRTPEEYSEKHIVNAELLTLDTIDEATAAAAAPDKEAPVLVYCRTGVRSAEAAQELAALGYTQVYDFGGIVDWPYATIEGDAPTAACGLSADQLPVGVKVVCGQTKSL